MIDKQTLDSILNDLARFYLSEFNEVNWSKVSMSGRIMEFAELGITAPGTKHQENNYVIPYHIESAASALTKIDLKYQLVVKEEYTGKGNQSRKARNLNLTIFRFRNRLMRARQQLMQII